MKIELTKAEMLAEWKRRHFLEPLRTDCTITRTDGIDLDSIAGDEMRQWYLKMLHTAPVEVLAPVDIALTAKLLRTKNDSGKIILPGSVVRVVAVKLSTWEREAKIINAGSAEARLQGNRFLRGGTAMPIAVISPGGVMELFSLGTSGTLPAVETLLVIEDPGRERYTMDESLLGMMCRSTVSDIQ